MPADVCAVGASHREEGHDSPPRGGGGLQYEGVALPFIAYTNSDRPGWAESPYVTVQPAREWALQRSPELAEAMDAVHAHCVRDPTDHARNECVSISLLNLLSKAVARQPSLCVELPHALYEATQHARLHTIAFGVMMDILMGTSTVEALVPRVRTMASLVNLLMPKAVGDCLYVPLDHARGVAAANTLVPLGAVLGLLDLMPTPVALVVHDGGRVDTQLLGKCLAATVVDALIVSDGHMVYASAAVTASALVSSAVIFGTCPEVWLGADAPMEEAASADGDVLVALVAPAEMPSQDTAGTVTSDAATECVMCRGTHSAGGHTCGRKRPTPVVSKTTRVSRSRNEWRSASGKSTSALNHSLPLAASAYDSGAAGGAPTRAEDSAAVNGVALVVVPLPVEAHEEHDNGAYGLSQSTTSATQEQDAQQVIPAPVGAHDGDASSLPSSTAYGFSFTCLLSRAPGASDGTYVYTLLGEDGTQRECNYHEALRQPLKATEYEDEWKCGCCSARGWSLRRARICLSCGAPSPEDEERLTQMKQAKRAEMASDRKRHLGLRRIASAPRELRKKVRASGAYSSAANDVGVDGTPVDGGAAPQNATMDDGPASEADDDQVKSKWSDHNVDALRHLDAIVSMLTLGKQGLLRKELRDNLQPECVATAFLLTPRLAEITDRVERDEPLNQQTQPDAPPLPDAPPPADSPVTSSITQSVNVQAATPMVCHAVGEPVVAGPAATALAPFAGCNCHMADCGSNVLEPQAASDNALCPQADGDASVRQTNPDDAPDKTHQVPMVPRVKAHWQALGQLPVERASLFASMM